MAAARSILDWLRQLQLEVAVSSLSPANIERAVQLLNKTSQMNLATRRLSVRELQEWSSHANHQVWTFHGRDRFGDYELCGGTFLLEVGQETAMPEHIRVTQAAC